MNATATHPRKQLLFALLSLADLALTWHLLAGDGRAYEANPVANWFLSRFGWLGLAAFKATVVAVVLGLTAVIARKRPHVAGRVLSLGCACLGAVVVYSVALGFTARASARDTLAEANRYAEAVNEDTRAGLRRREVFNALLARLRDEVLAGRLNLADAAGRLAASEAGRDDARLRLLAALFPDGTVEQRFACYVVVHAVGWQAAVPSQARRSAGRLGREFRQAYDRSPPPELALHLGPLAADEGDVAE